MLNILGKKGNQTMQFGKLRNIAREIYFFKSHVENEAGRLLQDLFLFF